MLIWTRFPRHEYAQEIILSRNVGCVIGIAGLQHVYPELDPNKPRWADLDARVNAVPPGKPIHIHPILNRMPNVKLDTYIANIDEFAFPIIERYRHRVKRWTLCNELLLCSHRLNGRLVQPHVFDFYERVSNAFPELDLWIGEYGLRSIQRVHGKNGILDSLYELKAAAPTFKGLVAVDYMDLSAAGSNRYVTSLKRIAPQLALGKFKEHIQHIKEKTGVQIAIETSVYTGPDPTQTLVAQQAKA